MSTSEQSLEDIAAAVPRVMQLDRRPLQRRLTQLQHRAREGKPVERGLHALSQAVEASLARAAARAAAVPALDFPAELPVSQRRDEIARAIIDHQVVVVCGETGSGKTTQLPKICLSVGRGVRGMIGHTQPRRIAARSVSARIAAELGVELGAAVGYKVRFGDHVSADSHIKLMTDGVLLAEIQTDPWLEVYDTLIIDEAHERSLNIDFLLGYLGRLLPRRPDLKLLITSATIDPQRFARHFGGAPVVEVSGRGYPVELRYRPLRAVQEEEQAQDQPQAILAAVDEVSRSGPGDVLVFLAGEREIRETAEALRKHHPPETEILPLYARLSAAEQGRVFEPHSRRRIVLATNVAETSLTVPGIRYVVDPGLARISRYSHRTKVQRLPVEKISQASAEQRKGRCGRVGPGICVRLYDEQDFADRERYTEPEILRTNLAAVILQMKSLGLGEVAEFPFIDPPQPKRVNDGYKLLEELGAVDDSRAVTPLGRRLARLPVDPRIGRMVLAAVGERCLTEVLVIASALSIQDPRDRPHDAQQAADEAHRRFQDPRSDFVTLLRLWEFYENSAKHLSRSKLTRRCREHFLSALRMREWHDVHAQLAVLVKGMGYRPNESPADYPEVHRALLAGLIGNVGFKGEQQTYLGARNAQFQIFPGSTLHGRGPKWLMAAELVETSRLYARTVARIEPEWIESVASHLIKCSYFDPHWERNAAQVAAYERTSLYGLIITPRRRVNYGPIDPVVSREIFLREALANGDYRSRAPFFVHNRRLLESVESLEAKSRRRDILVDEQTLYAFYDERIPSGIYSGPLFERWRVQAERSDTRRLFLTHDDVMRHGAAGVTVAQFPDHLELEGGRLALSYCFEPGDPADGVTVTLPLRLLNQVPAGRLEWLVPGLLGEKLTALIRALPKALRKSFVPAPEFAQACLEALEPSAIALTQALGAQLRRMTGVEVPPGAWSEQELPEHLRMRIRIVDDAGRQLGAGRDLEALRQALARQAVEQFERLDKRGLEREGMTHWDVETLPERITLSGRDLPLQGYPALLDQVGSVALRILDTPEDARAATRAGVRRLCMLESPQELRYLRKNLELSRAMCLEYGLVVKATAGPGAAAGSLCESLREALVTLAADRAFIGEAEPPRSQQEYARCLAAGRGDLMRIAAELCTLVRDILDRHRELRAQLREPVPRPARDDVAEQLDRLVYDGFVTDVPYGWLRHLPRYLKAIQMRLQRLRLAPERDLRRSAELQPLWQAYWEADAARKAALADFRWMLEELRVSLYAQELKTAFPVSVQRLQRRLESVASKA